MLEGKLFGNGGSEGDVTGGELDLGGGGSGFGLFLRFLLGFRGLLFDIRWLGSKPQSLGRKNIDTTFLRAIADPLDTP